MSKSKKKTRPPKGGRTTPKPGTAAGKIDAPRPQVGARDFTAALNEHLGEGMTEFTVGEHTFDVFATLPASAVEQLVAMQGSRTIVDGLQSTVAFVASCMPLESRERFSRWVNDPDNPVPFKLLDDMARWLVDGYTGRPTK